MTIGKITDLFLCQGHRQPMVKVGQATVLEDMGFEGDRHARQGSSRQVLLMDMETLKEKTLLPGEIRENITIEGIDLSKVTAGQVFFIGGEVTLEATGQCVPCYRLDEIRPGLRSDLDQKRGILATVLNGGVISIGDDVALEPTDD